MVDRARATAPHSAARRARPYRARLSLSGAACALPFGCASFTPSLLPRGWLLQGCVNGLSTAAGYGLGVLLAWLLRALTGRRPSAALRRRLWAALALLGVPMLAVSVWAGRLWQQEVHRLTGADPPEPYAWIPLLLPAAAVFGTVLAAARVVRWLIRRLARRLARVVPYRLALPIAIAAVTLLLAGLNTGLLWRGLLNAAGTAFGEADRMGGTEVSRPAAAQRSGSPASLVPWETLGRQGRYFVARGPTVAELAAFSGRPARQPVRVYVGLRSAGTVRERAALAVRELRRAGGFDRAALVVATATGTGHVDPAAAAAVEYLHNGDTAIVAVQYSYLPSWLSLLADPEPARRAGRELFEQVHAAWSALPADRRPRLLVTGTSLGVFGGEAAFDGAADLRARTDGVVWAGPPHFSPLHRHFTAERDPGTPEWLPVYGSGRTVRFAATPADLGRPGSDRPRPRVVYLQNGTDPVVFWSPRLAVERPDWLTGPRAPGVSPRMSWIPLVTFWQVTADLPFAAKAPPGHGHAYREIFADAWAAVAPPPGWTAQDTERLRARLRAGTG